MKRKNYISWEDLFMGVAELAAQRSKDPDTQVGACIVNNKKIVGVGYNGFPNGISDDDPINFPWTNQEVDSIKSKYAYVVHAELNAILNTHSSGQLKGATIYCTLPPCNQCVKAIIQSGITEVVYKSDWRNEDYHIIAQILLEKASIKCRQSLKKTAKETALVKECPACEGTGEDGLDRELPPNMYVCSFCSGKKKVSIEYYEAWEKFNTGINWWRESYEKMRRQYVGILNNNKFQSGVDHCKKKILEALNEDNTRVSR